MNFRKAVEYLYEADILDLPELDNDDQLVVDAIKLSAIEDPTIEDMRAILDWSREKMFTRLTDLESRGIVQVDWETKRVSLNQ